jgi:hypothetical protein
VRYRAWPRGGEGSTGGPHYVFYLSLLDYCPGSVSRTLGVLASQSSAATAFCPRCDTRLATGNTTSRGDPANRAMYPWARMLRAGLLKVKEGPQEVDRAVEGMGSHEAGLLEANLRFLGVMSNIAPMLGFLGTVTGHDQCLRCHCPARDRRPTASSPWGRRSVDHHRICPVRRHPCFGGLSFLTRQGGSFAP